MNGKEYILDLNFLSFEENSTRMLTDSNGILMVERKYND